MSINSDPPKITLDPRWKAARTLVQSGRQGAVDMFATLVEETIARHSDTSIEAAACFYEYGNTLFRAAAAKTADDEQQHALQDDQNAKEAAATAAEARLEQQGANAKPAAKDAMHTKTGTDTAQDKDETKGTDADEKEEKTGTEEAQDKDNTTTATKQHIKERTDNIVNQYEEGPDDDDIHLALEMMENAYSIFEEKAQQHPENDWIQDQLPRVLQGLGDVLRELHRMADAADAYSRALPYREEFVERHDKERDLTLEHLKNRRLLVEANILVAEALLGCEHGQHVVTSETKDMLVTADERVDYARGYYDKARDEFQETVLLMGRIAAIVPREELETEKENVCFAATLLMGVGETLAVFDEAAEQRREQPAAKKLKAT